MRVGLFSILLAVAILPGLAAARVGVGIGTGKIAVTETLLPGQTYDLPPLTVINTGDEVSEYSIGISYHEQQPELMPAEDWFAFSPDTFTLEPGQGQLVSIRLQLPVRASPGNYFAYVEGHPIVSHSGETRVNIAAAAKLNFQVGTSSIFAAWYYKLTSFWKAYSPWTNRMAIVIALVAVVFIFMKFFKIQVKFKQ